MTRANWIAITASTLGALLAEGNARATLMEELDTAQLTREAKAVQLGQVVSERSVWDPDQRMVFTYVRFRVEETLKGDPREEVTIRQPGGRAGEIRMVIHGLASFLPGERALVFLKHDDDGAPSVVGMAQGKFRVYRSPVTGEEMALFRAPKNLEFVTRGRNGRSFNVTRHPEEKRIPLRDLKEEIRTLVAEESR
jgi:hypothetical protein